MLFAKKLLFYKKSFAYFNRLLPGGSSRQRRVRENALLYVLLNCTLRGLLPPLRGPPPSGREADIVCEVWLFLRGVEDVAPYRMLRAFRGTPLRRGVVVSDG